MKTLAGFDRRNYAIGIYRTNLKSLGEPGIHQYAYRTLKLFLSWARTSTSPCKGMAGVYSSIRIMFV